ncbi:MAG: transposase [Salinisphaeraceae bacterium]
MTYDALRRGRVSRPGHAYLVTTVTRHCKPAFRDLHLARRVINELRRADLDGRTTTLAFVLMPDHLHWLLQLTGAATLSRTVHRFKGASSRAVNRQRPRDTALWQRAFHDHAIRDHRDVRRAARYIVANPLRANLVIDIADYPHWDAIWLGEESRRAVSGIWH